MRRHHNHIRQVPPVVSFANSGVTVSTSSVEVLAGNSQRYMLVIHNVGTAPVWIRLDGGTAETNKNSLRLLPGEKSNPLNYLPGSAVTAIALVSVDVHIVEGFALTPLTLFGVIDSLNNPIVDSLGNRIVA